MIACRKQNKTKKNRNKTKRSSDKFIDSWAETEKTIFWKYVIKFEEERKQTIKTWTAHFELVSGNVYFWFNLSISGINQWISLISIAVDVCRSGIHVNFLFIFVYQFGNPRYRSTNDVGIKLKHHPLLSIAKIIFFAHEKKRLNSLPLLYIQKNISFEMNESKKNVTIGYSIFFFFSIFIV